MDLNMGSDDKFFPGETNAVIGQKGNLIGFVGTADVYHNMSFRFLQMFKRKSFHLPVGFSFPDKTINAAGAINGYQLTTANFFSGISSSDYRRYPEFPRDNRGVGSSPTFISDNRGGNLHNRFPVWIR